MMPLSLDEIVARKVRPSERIHLGWKGAMTLIAVLAVGVIIMLAV
jgi:hypothetical protein